MNSGHFTHLTIFYYIRNTKICLVDIGLDENILRASRQGRSIVRYELLLSLMVFLVFI